MTKKTGRAVIIGAAAIANYPKVASYLNPSQDFYIYCDGGLFHQEKLERQLGCPLNPHLVVGDFDSHPAPENLSCPLIQLPCEKDDTDTWFAAKEAITRGFDQFLLIGMTGQRLDHTMGNLSILLHLYEQGLPALLVDDYSEMEIVGATPVKVSCSFSYFSLLSIKGDAGNVTIRNAKYPLDKAKIKSTYQYAISNQVLPNQNAEITVGTGCLLLIKIW